MNKVFVVRKNDWEDTRPLIVCPDQETAQSVRDELVRCPEEYGGDRDDYAICEILFVTDWRSIRPIPVYSVEFDVDGREVQRRMLYIWPFHDEEARERTEETFVRWDLAGWGRSRESFEAATEIYMRMRAEKIAAGTPAN